MKLYAKATNTKGKTEGVGDNIQIDTSFIKGNKVEYTAHYTTEGLMVYKQGVVVLDTITQGINLKGVCRDCGAKVEEGQVCQLYCKPCIYKRQ